MAMLEHRTWFKPTESDREASEGTMSRIHEALKRAAQERSTQLAAGLEAQVAEVAGDIQRSVTRASNVARPAAPSRIVAAGSPAVPLSYEELIMRCNRPEWRLGALYRGFPKPKIRESVSERVRASRFGVY